MGVNLNWSGAASGAASGASFGPVTAAIGGIAGALGGAFSSKTRQNRDTNAWFMRYQQKLNRENWDYQFGKELAEQKKRENMGLHTAVMAARRAGLHPLYALGHSPSMSPSPQMAGVSGSPGISSTSSSSTLGRMGAALSGAAQASLAAQEREQTTKYNNLVNKKINAEIESIQEQTRNQRIQSFMDLQEMSSIQKQNQATITGAGKPRPVDMHTLNTPFGSTFKYDKNTASASVIDDRYGDALSWIYGVPLLASDAYENYKPSIKKWIKEQQLKGAQARERTKQYFGF